MHPELRAAFDGLERRRRDLFDRLAGFDDAQLTSRPSPDAWCLLELTEHLVIVEELLLVQANDAARTRELRKTLRSRVMMPVVRFVLRNNIRVKAPSKMLLPKEVSPLEETGRRFDAARRGLTAYLENLGPG